MYIFIFPSLSNSPVLLFFQAKGLQKLRWYCQMCQKQCRDENGFKVGIVFLALGVSWALEIECNAGGFVILDSVSAITLERV
jgi:hypothetical protein